MTATGRSNTITQWSPYWSILIVFNCWKSLLSLIAFSTPSPAYDTSTTLALLHTNDRAHQDYSIRHSVVIKTLKTFCSSLTRWDAIYFSKIAERGYINEEEWAFGWGHSRAIVMTRQVLSAMIPGYIHLESPYAEIISAIVLSNACHLASVFVLYKLTILCCNHLRYPKNLALIASMLHILSPAGLFLTAPYSESLFSLLTFSGTYLYACSLKAINSKRYFLGNFLVVSSAAVFFAASTVRSNGLLNGLLFLFDFIPAVFGMLHGGFWPVIRVMILGIGGVMVGSGVLLPQFIAWQEFCGSSAYSPRPWCLHLFPSIYTWVQGQYWDVGLLRYWTLPNLPLFLLAAPAIYVLLISGRWGISHGSSLWSSGLGGHQSSWGMAMISRLAVIQIILAAMAVLSYHVQIITRLSSAYVVWYWWVGICLLDEGCAMKRSTGKGDAGCQSKSIWIVRWMVMYGLVQGVLFAGFLPPA